MAVSAINLKETYPDTVGFTYNLQQSRMTVSAINLGVTHPDDWIHLRPAMTVNLGKAHPDMFGFTYSLQ
jgi:hypothetical protein